jgi:hypothetical protein
MTFRCPEERTWLGDGDGDVLAPCCVGPQMTDSAAAPIAAKPANASGLAAALAEA